MCSCKLLRLAALLAAVLAPSSLADGRHPGSVLIYPIHRTGGGHFTIVSVTNTNALPATPTSFGGTTSVHFQYLNTERNLSNPFVPLKCTLFDRHELLSPGDTLSLLTSCHDAVKPGGQEGFLVVSAEDPSQFDVAWAFDALIGSELVINSSGSLFAVNAIPLRAGETAPGIPTDFNGNGQLDFDGIEYEALPDVLILDSFVAVAGSHLALLNLTGGPMALNVVLLEVWNDDEYPLSATFTMSCWFDRRLSGVSKLFEPYFLAGSTPNDPAELDLTCNGVGNVETGWARLDSLGVFLGDGTPVSADGALLGCLTAGPVSLFDGGHLLWESEARQTNGVAFCPGFGP